MADLLSLHASQEAQGRRRQMLRTAFGPAIAAALVDPTVIEVMVNPDGRLWIDRASVGRQDSGERMGSAEVERIIRLVAAHVHREVHAGAPIVSAELPETGERFAPGTLVLLTDAQGQAHGLARSEGARELAAVLWSAATTSAKRSEAA